MSKREGVAKSAIIMIIFSLGSKLLGFIREIFIASKFGAGIETDTYLIALTATGLFASLIGTAINTTMIPVLSEIESKEGKGGKIRHTNNLLNITALLSLLVIIIGWIISPILIKILAGGFYGEQFKLAVKLFRIGMPIIFFTGIVSIFRGFLQSELRFTESAASNFPFNFVYIFFLIFLSKRYGIVGLMVAGVLAVASQITIQIPGIIDVGYKYKFHFNIRDKYLKKIIILTLPVFIGVAVNELNIIVDRTLASSLSTGSISALNYSNRLNNLILGVFISAITTVIFPLLSKESNNDNISGMKKIMSYGINLILIITVPATVGLIVLVTPIVEIAFQRGAFDAVATLMTSQALIFYSVGLVAMALNLLLTRVYYSLQDTKTPMINGAISVAFNIVLNIILVKYMAHAGLALATSITTTIATFLLLYGLKKKIGSLGTKAYINTFLKTGLASGVMGVVAYLIYHGLYGVLGVSKLYNLISLLVAVGIGVVVYVVLCYVFKVDEVRDVIHKIKVRLIK